MFTQESLILRDYFFPRITVSETNELKDLYKYFVKIKVSPIHIIQRKFIKTKEKIRIDDQIPFSKENNFQKSFIKLKLNQIVVHINLYGEEIPSQLMDEIIYLIQFVGSFSKSKIKKLTINYYLFDNRKQINQKKLGRNEINSGFCRIGNETSITIYRKEELFKVTIHELIHAFEYDKVEDSFLIIKHYQKKYNISDQIINTHEAYTEIWANLINCFYISQKAKRSKYNLFLLLVSLEKEFCKFQSEKIFYLSQLSEKKIKINQETNVLAYFIIRCELFNKLTQFLKFCRVHNKNYIHLNKKKEWFQLLLKKKGLNKNNRRFNKINNQSFLFNTLRMSLNELSIY